jgi:signal peptidase I
VGVSRHSDENSGFAEKPPWDRKMARIFWELFKKPEEEKSKVREYAEAIIVAVVLALIIRSFIIQAFRIPSGSMEDTLLIGDFLLANKFVYGAKVPFTDWRLPALRKPKQGDIIIFKYPQDPSKDFIKRCIATEGQVVEIIDKKLYVDGKWFPDPSHSKYIEPYVIPKGRGQRDNFGPYKVPPDHLFMMGDNRDNSRDSRFWGPLSMKHVKGKAIVLYWSWRPDFNAPRYYSIFSIPKMLLYNIIHFPQRVRWSRIFDLVR